MRGAACSAPEVGAHSPYNLRKQYRPHLHVTTHTLGTAALARAARLCLCSAGQRLSGQPPLALPAAVASRGRSVRSCGRLPAGPWLWLLLVLLPLLAGGGLRLCPCCFLQQLLLLRRQGRRWRLDRQGSRRARPDRLRALLPNRHHLAFCLLERLPALRACWGLLPLLLLLSLPCLIQLSRLSWAPKERPLPHRPRLCMLRLLFHRGRGARGRGSRVALAPALARRRARSCLLLIAAKRQIYHLLRHRRWLARGHCRRGLLPAASPSVLLWLLRGSSGSRPRHPHPRCRARLCLASWLLRSLRLLLPLLCLLGRLRRARARGRGRARRRRAAGISVTAMQRPGGDHGE